MKKKIVDDRGRLFGVISVVDIGVIAVVIILAVAVYYKFLVVDVKKAVVDSQPITFQVKAEGVRAYTTDSLKVGDEFYEVVTDTTYDVGKITDIEVTPAQRYLTLQDGTNVLAPVENRYDVIITVEGKGTCLDGRYYLNNLDEFGVNAARSYCTLYTAISATVVSIG